MQQRQKLEDKSHRETEKATKKQINKKTTEEPWHKQHAIQLAKTQER